MSSYSTPPKVEYILGDTEIEGTMMLLTTMEGKKRNKKYYFTLSESFLYRFRSPEDAHANNPGDSSTHSWTSHHANASKARDCVDMRTVSYVGWWPSDDDKQAIEIILNNKNIVRVLPEEKQEKWLGK